MMLTRHNDRQRELSDEQFRHQIRRRLRYLTGGLLALTLVLNVAPVAATHLIVRSDDIVDGEVRTVDLGNGSVTSAKISDGAVKTADLGNGAVTSAKIRDETIQSLDVGDGSLTGRDIRDRSLTGSEVAGGSIDGFNIALDSLVGGHVQDGTLTGLDVATSSLNGSDIQDATLTGADIATSSLNGSDIADATLTGADVATSSLNGSDILDNSLTGSDVNESTFTPLDAHDAFTARCDPGGPTYLHCGSLTFNLGRPMPVIAFWFYKFHSENTGDWSIGRCQTRLDGATTATVGNGHLHGRPPDFVAAHGYGATPVLDVIQLGAGNHTISLWCSEPTPDDNDFVVYDLRMGVVELGID